MKWESLHEPPGKVDEYLDQLIQLVCLTGFIRDIIKNKIRQGLSPHLRRLWGTAMDVPQNLPFYMDRLQKLRQLEEQ